MTSRLHRGEGDRARSPIELAVLYGDIGPVGWRMALARARQRSSCSKRIQQYEKANAYGRPKHRRHDKHHE
jgi:hypothetical protein